MNNYNNNKNSQVMGFCYSWLFGLITGMALVGLIFSIFLIGR